MHPLPHLFTGALVGQMAAGPTGALVGGALSHLILDVIPHTEGETFDLPRLGPVPLDLVEAGLELVVGAAALAWLAGVCTDARPVLLALGALGGLAPDLIDQPLERVWNVTLLHPRRLHWTVRRRYWVLGILTQVAVAAIAAALLWRAGGCG